MFSPSVELALEAGVIAARNVIRNAGDPDGDTISECTRSCVEALGERGPLLFGAALFAAGGAFWWHICRPILEETR